MTADVILSGQMNLLLYPELNHRAVRRIFDLLETRDDVLSLLEHRPGRVKICLGSENNRSELFDTAVITAGYSISGQDAGALQLIGPMRMNYPLVLSCINYLSDKVGKMLTVLMNED